MTAIDFNQRDVKTLYCESPAGQLRPSGLDLGDR